MSVCVKIKLKTSCFMICPSFFRNVTYEKIKLHLDHDLELHQGQKVQKQKKSFCLNPKDKVTFRTSRWSSRSKKMLPFLSSHTPFNLKSHPFRWTICPRKATLGMGWARTQRAYLQPYCRRKSKSPKGLSSGLERGNGVPSVNKSK